MESYEILWKKALDELQNRISNIAFNSYLKVLKCVDLDNGVLILQAPDSRCVKFIANIEDKIIEVLKESTGITEYKIIVSGSDMEYYSTQSAQEDSYSPINPNYTFDSFVVGNSNKFLHAAAKAVAKDPGVTYNPLFIYGGTGLGKTHIMHAIANELQANQPKLKVAYVTCEKFTNDLISTIRQGKSNADGENFRKRYRNVDVLIIDDIQFLAKKTSTQEEFFNTFNELYSKNKQIILSADCPPSQIELLEDRLKTRFQSGLLAEVIAPDVETKIAILQKKAMAQKYILNFEVASFLAEIGGNNVRSLEGLLNKVIFISLLKEEPITLELAKEALSLSKPQEQESLTPDDVISAVCNYYKIKKTDLIGKRKNKEIAEPRQICMYLMTELLNLPLVAVGKAMGGKDHTTIMHGRNKISELLKSNPRISTEVNDLKNLINKQ